MSNVVQLGTTGYWGTPELAAAWESAGRPPLVSGGRLYDDQKYLWDGWNARLPGFNPADNPDDETQRLAHCRFGALDLFNPARDRAACERAGLIFPYSYEPWHCELPEIRRFPIVRSLPMAVTDPITPALLADLTNGEDMFIAMLPNGWFLVLPQGNAKPRAVVLDGGSQADKTNIPRIKFDTANSIDMLNAAVQF